MMFSTPRFTEITPMSLRNAAAPSWETAAVTRKIWIGPPTGGGPG